MPRRKQTSPREPLDAVPPQPAERQAEIERILKLSPGELAPEKCARRQQALDAQQLRTLRESYRVCGVDTLDNSAVTRKHKGGKE